MIIETWYSLDDVVWVLRKQETFETEPCKFCRGARVVYGCEGSTLACPKCNGNGGERKHANTSSVHARYEYRWTVTGGRKVRAVMAEFNWKTEKVVVKYEVEGCFVVVQEDVRKLERNAEKEALKRNRELGVE